MCLNLSCSDELRQEGFLRCVCSYLPQRRAVITLLLLWNWRAVAWLWTLHCFLLKHPQGLRATPTSCCAQTPDKRQITHTHTQTNIFTFTHSTEAHTQTNFACICWREIIPIFMLQLPPQIPHFQPLVLWNTLKLQLNDLNILKNHFKKK